MFLSRALIYVLFLLPSAVAAQTEPVEYVTFMSHGKAISCADYQSRDAPATLLFLRGATPADLALGKQQARFFADHGFRVLLPDYFSATGSADATAANYTRWAQVVEDIVVDLRSRSASRRKIVLAGQGLGASLALVAASHRMEIVAVAEWSGLVPNDFFSQVQSLPPLLIFHGEQDKQVPVVNARQINRLCKLKDFACDLALYPAEGELFSPQAMDSSNQRALTFFRTYLWASLPKRAE